MAFSLPPFFSLILEFLIEDISHQYKPLYSITPSVHLSISKRKKKSLQIGYTK